MYVQKDYLNVATPTESNCESKPHGTHSKTQKI